MIHCYELYYADKLQLLNYRCKGIHCFQEITSWDKENCQVIRYVFSILMHLNKRLFYITMNRMEWSNFSALLLKEFAFHFFKLCMVPVAETFLFNKLVVRILRSMFRLGATYFTTTSPFNCTFRLYVL